MNKRLSAILDKLLWAVIGALISLFFALWLPNIKKKYAPIPKVAIISSKVQSDFDVQNYCLNGFMKQFDLTCIKDLIKPVYFDNYTTSEEIVDKTKEILENDNYVLIIGNTTSTLSHEMTQTIAKSPNAIPFILPLATATDIIKVAEQNKYNGLLMLPPDNTKQTEEIKNFCKQQNWDKIVIIADDENPVYSVNMNIEISHKLRNETNASIMCEELIGIGNGTHKLDNTFKSINKPDAIIYSGLPHSAMLLVDYLIANGIDIPIVFSDGCLTHAFVDYASKYKGAVFLCSIKNTMSKKNMIDFEDYGKDAALLINNIIRK